MVQYIPIPPPSPRTLLPPLLACLPTSFASPYPPPALYPLLSPVLRQRVRYLATPTPASSSARPSTESWLPLLCRHSTLAQRLIDIVSESDAFELHPVSGEIDFGEVEALRYRRLDEETLQCRVGVPGLGLLVIYLWCSGDAEEEESGWRVCEVRPLDGDAEGEERAWYPTVAEADEAVRAEAGAVRYGGDQSLLGNGNGTHRGSTIPSIADVGDGADDDDDDYWARYDNTPGRTPGMTPGAKASPLPDQGPRAKTTSEADYYAQYAQVQPAMDGDDPSEAREAVGESTLDGEVLASAMGGHQNGGEALVNRTHDQTMNGLNIDLRDGKPTKTSNGIYHPATAASTPSIERLQDSAELQSIAEVAIKQHVGASVKSLFRLCRSTGMDRGDFDEMIREELEGLKMMDEA